MTETLKNAAQELEKQMRFVKERNSNIIKSHNNGLSKQEILDTFEINEDTLNSVLKSAKRDGLLKSEVREEKKPREPKAPKPPVITEKPVLKENDIEKPKSKGRPKKTAAVEVVKPEPVVETVEEPGVDETTEEIASIGTLTGKTIEVPKINIPDSPKVNIPPISTGFIQTALEKQIESFRDQVNKTLKKERLNSEEVNHYLHLVAYERSENEKLTVKLSVAEKQLLQKDEQIAALQKQVDRFDFMEQLAIGLMRNTIALVDQAEEGKSK